MAGHRHEAARRRVALLLAAGRSKKEAAARAGVSRRSVSNWVKEGAFAREVSELRNQLLSRTVGLLAGAGAKAVKTFVDLLGSNEKGPTRLGAANGILGHMLRGVELVDLADKLAELERRLGKGKNK